MSENTEPRWLNASRSACPVQLMGTWCEAAYAGTCACGCNARIELGDDLVRAEGVDGWCLMSCTLGGPGSLW